MRDGEIGVLTFAVIMIIITGFVSCESDYEYKCHKIKIVEVGVCDEDGYCAVKYDTGKYGNRYLPMVGKSVEVCKQVKKEK